jgi:hypothetical protein
MFVKHINFFIYLVVPEKFKELIDSGISAKKHSLKIARKHSKPCEAWRNQGFSESLKASFFRHPLAYLDYLAQI